MSPASQQEEWLSGRLINILFGASSLHPFYCFLLGNFFFFFLEGRVCKEFLGGGSREYGEGAEKGQSL